MVLRVDGEGDVVRHGTQHRREIHRPFVIPPALLRRPGEAAPTSVEPPAPGPVGVGEHDEVNDEAGAAGAVFVNPDAEALYADLPPDIAAEILEAEEEALRYEVDPGPDVDPSDPDIDNEEFDLERANEDLDDEAVGGTLS